MIVKIVVKLENGYQYGTGSLINKNSVLTCYHVLKNAQCIYIMYNNYLYTATIEYTNDICDIAVLSTECNNSQYFKISQNFSDTLTVKSYWGDNTFVMTQKTNVIASHYKTELFPTVLLIDIKASKGMSGAPLFNEHNEIVSILLWNTEIGTGCIHPELFKNILEKRFFKSGKLPFSTAPVTIIDVINSGYNYTFGEKVTIVNKSIGNIQPGDFISHVNKIQLNSSALDLKSMCYLHAPNYTLQLTVHKKRTNYKKCIKVKLLTI